MPKGDSAMIGNRRGHPPSSLPAPCVSSALASGTWPGGRVVGIASAFIKVRMGRKG
ncbi:hypothetical protein BKA56DRAFT_569131 [Ilyonectria sp. MPI-CAGE-AT-0026]|nr:hypothetical protein BKA56DRAFT_569131 [Ilyonectria sp. MPI-CAGE-AT-0026]